MVKQKMVLKVEMKCHKCQTKALQIAAQAHGSGSKENLKKEKTDEHPGGVVVFHLDGVESVGLEGDDSDVVRSQVVVIGDGVDVVGLTKSLRRKVGHADIMSVVDMETEA